MGAVTSNTSILKTATPRLHRLPMQTSLQGYEITAALAQAKQGSAGMRMAVNNDTCIDDYD